jgi:hypothetical protein
VIELEAPVADEALLALRRARRRNIRSNIHWIDALYRVYVVGLGAALFVLIASSWLPNEKLDQTATDDLVAHGPGWLGLAFAVAVAFGLRSGARGGPLTIEAAAVQHELLAPVDRGLAYRGPALKQLRFLAFAGAVLGAIVGVLATHQIPANPVATTAAAAAAFGAAGVAASAVAMVLSGRRIGIWVANGVALVLLAWSAADATLGLATSPLSWLGSIALWELRFSALGVVALALVAVVVVVAVRGLGGTSLEQARRRAGLVSQLRFAVTLQDVRTVVLLRRQLAQEKPRHDPWIRLRYGRGRLPAAWRRDWQGLLRYPLVRIVRMVALAVVAGLALGVTWRGAYAAFLVSALALYLAAYDAVEPIAQEVDHPTRWSSMPNDPGRFLLDHLPAALVVMLVLCTISALTAMALVPPDVVVRLGASLLIPVAGAATVAAAVSTSLGAPDTAKLIGLGADMLGFVLAARLVLPPALVVVSLLPLLAAGVDADALDTRRVSNTTMWSLLGIGVGFLYLRYRKPSRV